jgi:DNA repair protein RadC
MVEYKKLNIKEWALEDRPREKLLSQGSRQLTDAELIAILIGSGNTEETAVELSRRILAAAGNDLNELGRKGIEWLKSFNGIGEAKAVSIAAAIELGKRRKEAGVFEKKIIQGSNDVAEYFFPILNDLPHEEFWVMLCNRGNKIIDCFRLSQGGIAGTVTDIRLIMKSAVEKLASSIVICHNHPSGNIKPSKEDENITKKIREAAKVFDIGLLDHIIIGNNRYFSFADEGLIING